MVLFATQNNILKLKRRNFVQNLRVESLDHRSFFNQFTVAVEVQIFCLVKLVLCVGIINLSVAHTFFVLFLNSYLAQWKVNISSNNTLGNDNCCVLIMAILKSSKKRWKGMHLIYGDVKVEENSITQFRYDTYIYSTEWKILHEEGKINKRQSMRTKQWMCVSVLMFVYAY